MDRRPQGGVVETAALAGAEEVAASTASAAVVVGEGFTALVVMALAAAPWTTLIRGRAPGSTPRTTVPRNTPTGRPTTIPTTLIRRPNSRPTSMRQTRFRKIRNILKRQCIPIL